MLPLRRLTHSARGETFNPLIWPSLFCTFAYGVGFAILLPLGIPVGTSSLYVSMAQIGTQLPVIWGSICIVTIFGGLFFLLFNKPPLGKFSGLLGFMVWCWAGFCYVLTGNWLVLAAVVFPNMWFWFWQYLTLTVFRHQDIKDEETIRAYNDGKYDDGNGGRQRRLNNRGVDRQ